MESRLGRWAVIVGGAALILLFGALAWGTLADRTQVFPTAGAVRALPEVQYHLADGRSGALVLPGSLKHLAPRTALTLTAQVDAKAGEALLIKTVYARLELYADGQLIYACGQAGSYPDFLLDPSTIIAIVPLNGARQLRLTYTSPSQRDTLSLPAMLVGDEPSLFTTVLRENAFSLLFSLTLMMMGLVLAATGVFMLRGVPRAGSFLWLGLFSILTGAWVFGECDLTAFLLPYPSLLYLLAFSGLFTLAIPFLLYGLTVLEPRNPWPMRLMAIALGAAALTAFALQLFGIVALSRSMYLFHVLVPLAFVVFAACLAWEAVRHKNRMARRLMWPILMLAASAVLERINYSVRFTDLLSSFFQVGTLIFVLALSVIGSAFARDALRAQAEKALLELEVAATGRQLMLQRAQYVRLTDDIGAARAARHDLRHQLTALGGYADRADTAGMKAYLMEMLGALPEAAELPLCENYAVNAVAQYYRGLAEGEGIRTEFTLRVPEHTGAVLATDLCIVIGNMMENAIEACRYVQTNALIRVRADERDGHLVVVVDNDFDGKWSEQDGVIHSRKRDFESPGVGISSIRAIAQKYGGYAEFTAREHRFESAAVMYMD